MKLIHTTIKSSQDSLNDLSYIVSMIIYYIWIMITKIHSNINCNLIILLATKPFVYLSINRNSFSLWKEYMVQHFDLEWYGYSLKCKTEAPPRFELGISCLLDRRFNQLSHGAFHIYQSNRQFYDICQHFA